MDYVKSRKYDVPDFNARIMGPNPVKLEEELLTDCGSLQGRTVLDLGSGQGVTSAFLALEYGCTVFAADLWSDPTDNMRFFERAGLDASRVIPVHADALSLPFAHEFFDAAVCTDSYNYFGRDANYLDKSLLPFIKRGGYIYIAVPGMKKDCHDDLPDALLASWTPDQLDYIHDADYWRKTVGSAKNCETVCVSEMESNAEVWQDWLKCDNEYAVNDRKAFEAGGGEYLNFIKIVLRRK